MFNKKDKDFNPEESLKQIKNLRPKLFSNTPNREEIKHEIDSIIEHLYNVSPNNTQVLIVYGAILCDNGLPYEALEILKTALKLGSNDRNLFRNIAIAKMNLKEHRHQAKEYFDKANNYQPDQLTFEAYFDPQAH